MSDYEAQHRGGDDEYERYLNGMDQSMRQKVALTAAHLLGEGKVADMGMGSGGGTAALASLYPRVSVVGVDVNTEMVERAREKHQLPNVEFIQGDIAESVFEPDTLDGIFDSSVLHHVTSFNDYDHEMATVALRAQVQQLKLGGSLIVRDFVAPPEGTVFLELPAHDGDDSDSPSSCSTARLFERFAREFKKLAKQPGFDYERVPEPDSPGLDPGWRRYQVSHKVAAEFLLRKDYRADWDSEVLEEYTYFTHERFDREFARLGLRLLASLPIHNPWIVANRFVGRAKLRGVSGEALPFPATNHLVVGEKVAPSQGVRFTVARSMPPTGFLTLHGFVQRSTGARRDLVRRPGTALDVVPWFRDRGGLYVLARKSHPRPLLQLPLAAPSLDGATPVGHVTEPILVIQSDAPVAFTAETALGELMGVAPDAIIALAEVATYYPSPGGLLEEVRAIHVEIEPCYVNRGVENLTGFSTGSSVRAIDAQQVLRAAQVGALPDARLELNVYQLLLDEGQPLGPWIGATTTLGDDDGPEPAAFFDLPRRRSYLPAATRAGFLELSCAQFDEVSASGAVLTSQAREYVVPRELSCSTIACALLRKHRGEVLLGLDADDLAAAQCFGGSSALWVTPAWRLPKTVHTLEQAERWVAERLREEYSVQAHGFTPLGGRYHPSAGVTPEVVFPLLTPVRCLESDPLRKLTWVSLSELRRNIARVQDGHLRVCALRAAHALLGND